MLKAFWRLIFRNISRIFVKSAKRLDYNFQDCLKYTRLRVAAAIRQLGEVQDQQFPYPDAEEALKLIGRKWQENLDLLIKTPLRNREVCAAQCSDTLRDIRYFLPFVGLIDRCAAVHHAFELYGPLRLMAKLLLCPVGDDPVKFPLRLILSSGWDYGPQSSRQISEELSEFVFIILPVCEAANPLFIPLAGHELGHAVWERMQVPDALASLYEENVKAFLTANKENFPELNEGSESIELKPIFAEACKLVRRQLEEIFCDFIGLYLFGESYLHAFTYFLSPDFPGERSPQYPTVSSRLQLLMKAAAVFQEKWETDAYADFPNLEDLYEARTPRPDDKPVNKMSSEQQRLLQSGIDRIAIEMVDPLLEQIERLAERETWKQLRDFDQKTRAEIREKCYRWAVPSDNAKSVSNILNAAWDAQSDKAFWDGHPSLNSLGAKLDDPIESHNYEVQKLTALHEFVLKNFEVLEYEHILEEPETDD